MEYVKSIYWEGITQYPTVICEDCGQEYDRGIMSWIRHAESCQGGAPNINIANYHESIKNISWEKEQEAKRELMFMRMTREERDEYSLMIHVGIPITKGAVGFGAVMMRKIVDFEKKMFIKYNID